MGTKIGWAIAIFLVLGIAAIVVVKVAIPAATPPTNETLRRGFMSKVEVGKPLTLVLDAEPTAPGNAADDYVKAVAVYTDNADAIKAAMADDVRLKIFSDTSVLPQSTVEVLNALRTHVAAGAKKKEMRYSFEYGPKEFLVGSRWQPGVDLHGVWKGMELLWLYHLGRKEYDQAIDILQEALILGKHMTDERVHADMLARGLQIQRDAANKLFATYQQRDPQAYAQQMNAANEYFTAAQSAAATANEKINVIWRAKPNPGDLFNIIENDEDRSYKVLATLTLGLVRYTHKSRPGDQRVVAKLIEQHAGGSDPFLASAAKAAKNLSEDEFLYEISGR